LLLEVLLRGRSTARKPGPAKPARLCRSGSGERTDRSAGQYLAKHAL
jgi:hypothetical protein